MSFIYLAVYADGTSYVGQTIGDFSSLESRYRAYENKAAGLAPSQRACFALGMPALGVIEYCPPEKLDEREKYWIGIHRQDGKNLNVQAGGRNVQQVTITWKEQPDVSPAVTSEALQMLATWQEGQALRLEARIAELLSEVLKTRVVK